MSENKRRPGKKPVAFLAFAAALLASNAVSVMAAAEETSGSDFVQNPDLTDVKFTGRNLMTTSLLQRDRQRLSRRITMRSTRSRISVFMLSQLR